MGDVIALLAATVTPSPGPTSVRTPDPELVTPGVAGFLVVFLLALATIVLVRSMTGHLRKVRYSPDPSQPEGEAGPADGTAAERPAEDDRR